MTEPNNNEGRFLIAHPRTHFRYYPTNSIVECTHGGWSGEIKFEGDGTCIVDVSFKKIKYDSYEFTQHTSIDSYLEEKEL